MVFLAGTWGRGYLQMTPRHNHQGAQDASMGKDSQKPILVAPCMTCTQAAHASQSPVRSRGVYNDGEDPVTPGIFLVILELCFLCLVCPHSPVYRK